MTLRRALKHAAGPLGFPLAATVLMYAVPFIHGDELPDSPTVAMFALFAFLTGITLWALDRYVEHRKARRCRAGELLVAAEAPDSNNPFASPSSFVPGTVHELPELQSPIMLVRPLSREAWLEAIQHLVPRPTLGSRLSYAGFWLFVSLMFFGRLFLDRPITVVGWVFIVLFAVIWLVVSLPPPLNLVLRRRALRKFRQIVESPEWAPPADFHAEVSNAGMMIRSSVGAEQSPWDRFRSVELHGQCVMLRCKASAESHVLHRSQLDDPAEWERLLQFLQERFPSRS